MDHDFARYLPWMFILFGVFFTALSAWLIQRALRGRHWRDLEGRVIGHQYSESRDYDSGRTRIFTAPEIEYRLPGQPPQRLVDDVASRNPPPVGAIVKLRYNPDDHDQVIVWAPLSRGLFFVIFLAMGLVFIGCGLVAMAMLP